LKGALFLDRDGTLIVDRHYIGDPSLVELLPGAADSIRDANARAIPVIVVTNQSGIGRGIITMEQFHAVSARMATLLGEQRAVIDATYHCPHWPDIDGECECRKPGLGMYRQAAKEHGLTLAQSAFIGDRWRDVEPGVLSGGFAVLVPSANTPPDDVEMAARDAHVMTSLHDATRAALDFVDSAAAGSSHETTAPNAGSPLHNDMADNGN
jgi:histidinol-phosphate phosphatase family protein